MSQYLSLATKIVKIKYDIRHQPIGHVPILFTKSGDVRNKPSIWPVCTEVWHPNVVEFFYCCHGLYSNGMNDLLFRQKTSKFSTLWKIFNSYIYVSVVNDPINNSRRYFTWRVCNLGNIVTSGHEILVISLYFLKYGNLKTKFPSEFWLYHYAFWRDKSFVPFEYDP